MHRVFHDIGFFVASFDFPRFHRSIKKSAVTLRMCSTSCCAAFVSFYSGQHTVKLKGLCPELKGCEKFSGHSAEG